MTARKTAYMPIAKNRSDKVCKRKGESRIFILAATVSSFIYNQAYFGICIIGLYTKFILLSCNVIILVGVHDLRVDPLSNLIGNYQIRFCTDICNPGADWIINPITTPFDAQYCCCAKSPYCRFEVLFCELPQSNQL